MTAASQKYAVPVTARPAAAAVVERWRLAGLALEAMRRRELRELTDAEALLDLLRYLPRRESGSGLVEQQRLFALARPG
jgi:hypothetical protein